MPNASSPTSSDSARRGRGSRFASVLSLFRIPSFSLMMLSRLLSGHLLIGVFGVQFLVTDRGFSNAVAALVLLPFGIGYFCGTVGGGFVVAALDRVMPGGAGSLTCRSPRCSSPWSRSSAPSSITATSQSTASSGP